MKRLSRLLLHLYPRRWRRRYGQELEALVNDLLSGGDRSRRRIVASLVAGAAEECVAAVRRPTLRGAASGIVVAVASVAVAFAVAGVPFGGSPGTALERQLRADTRESCAHLRSGQRATAIAMNPVTGAIVAKVVQICGEPA